MVLIPELNLAVPLPHPPPSPNSLLAPDSDLFKFLGRGLVWVEGPNSFEFAALEGLLRVPLVLGLLSSPSWSWGEGSNMDANGLWVVSLRICHFELSAPLSLSISVSLSLALFFSFRPSAFHTASSVSKTVSLPASLILGWGGGAGQGIGTTGVPPRIDRFSGAWAGDREREDGGGVAHLRVLPIFPPSGSAGCGGVRRGGDVLAPGPGLLILH